MVHIQIPCFSHLYISICPSCNWLTYIYGSSIIRLLLYIWNALAKSSTLADTQCFVCDVWNTNQHTLSFSFHTVYRVFVNKYILQLIVICFVYHLCRIKAMPSNTNLFIQTVKYVKLPLLWLNTIHNEIQRMANCGETSQHLATWLTHSTIYI